MRNMLSLLALAALVGALPGSALAQRRSRRPAPPRPNEALKRIDQRLDRLERTLKSLASSIGRLNKMNSARDARVRRLEAVVRRMAAQKKRPAPVRKAPPKKPPVRKAPPRRPVSSKAHRRIVSFGGKLPPEVLKKLKARFERVKKAMAKMPPERRKAMEARMKAWRERFFARAKAQPKKSSSKARGRVFSFGGKLPPEVRKRIEARLKEAGKKMSPERRERIEIFLKKLRERKEDAEKKERGRKKSWSPLRIRAEVKKPEGRERFFRFFSPEKIREFARKHPQIVRAFRRMLFMRNRGRFGFHGPMSRRPGMRGMARPPMERGRCRGMGPRRMGMHRGMMHMHRGMMGRRGHFGMGKCMHGRKRMGRSPMQSPRRFSHFRRPAGPRPPMAFHPGRVQVRVRPFHAWNPKAPRAAAPAGKPRIFVLRKGEKGFPQGFKAMVLERMKSEKGGAEKHRRPRRAPKTRVEHHRKGPRGEKVEKGRFHREKGRREREEHKKSRHRRHGKLV